MKQQLTDELISERLGESYSEDHWAFGDKLHRQTLTCNIFRYVFLSMFYLWERE